MFNPQDIIDKNKKLECFVNNDFIIIPFDRIGYMSLNDVEDEDTMRLHIDILKNGGQNHE